MSTNSKRAASSNYPYKKSHHRPEIFLNKSSSSSASDENDEDDVKTLDDISPDPTYLDMDQRKTYTNPHRRSSMNRTEFDSPTIQELLQSNMDLK